MTTAESCREQLSTLNQKLKETKEKLTITEDKKEREKLKIRITSINQALKSVREQLKFFDPDSCIKQNRKTSSYFKHRQDTQLSIGEDFFARNKEIWSDIEGKSWAQIEDEQRENDLTLSGYKKSEIEEYMAQACERLTYRQKVYINEYFNEGKALWVIAEEYGVDKSTVGSVIKNGLRRIQDWVDAKISINEFTNEDNTFDWKAYLEKNNKVITDRQRELLLLILSKQVKSKVELAEKLNLKQSTVVRTLQKATKTITQLELKGKPTYPIEIENWTEADVFSIALQLDMPLNFYYKYCFDRKQRYNGLTRYTYEITKRVRAGRTAQEISDEFGISIKTARGIVGLVKRKGYISKINECRDIEPKISTLVSDNTYVKLQNFITKYKQ